MGNFHFLVCRKPVHRFLSPSPPSMSPPLALAWTLASCALHARPLPAQAASSTHLSPSARPSRAGCTPSPAHPRHVGAPHFRRRCAPVRLQSSSSAFGIEERDVAPGSAVYLVGADIKQKK